MLKVFYLVFLAISLFSGFSAWRGISAHSNTWLDIAIATALLLAGVGLTKQTFTARLVVSDTCIRHGSLFRSHSMRLDQIRYRREHKEDQAGMEGGNVDCPELVLPTGRPVPQNLKGRLRLRRRLSGIDGSHPPTLKTSRGTTPLRSHQ
jgi:hypothetical protein